MGNRTPPRIVMGFDYGTKCLGVAVGQTVTATANPLTTLAVKNYQPDWHKLMKLIREWQPHVLVVGLPSLADGSENALIQAIHQFKRQLQQQLQLPVYLIDETLSTVAAHAELRERKRGGFLRLEKKDAVAAQIILQTWLTECA